MQALIPRKLKQLFESTCRYIVLYGGRGGAKSYGVADFLIFKAIKGKKRILCTREYQTSIKDSVHKLITDRISFWKLNSLFIITLTSIRTVNGSEFIFKGIALNTKEIKSTEGIDYCWVEEAETVTSSSWDILTPTIRKENSQIILTFNPDDEKNNTYQRFVINPFPNSTIIYINYWDNLHFPDVLRSEMEYCKKNDYEKYLHIWEGKPKKYSEALIFKGKYRVENFEPFDPEKDDRLYFGCDWGFAVDPTALVRSFVRNNKLHIEYEAHGVGIELDDLPAMFDKVPGSREWKIIADCARPETISYMVKKGFKVKGCAKWKGCAEDGIEYIKSFEEIIIHPRCKESKDEFGNYRFKVDKNTGDILPIIVKKSDHIPDALRYSLEGYIIPSKKIAYGFV